MTSPRTGQEVANQFEIYTPEGAYFQSYRTVIAFKANDGTVYLHNGENGGYSWDCSTTTAKYRNEFLGEDTKETRRKVKEGVYKLVNLN